MPSPTSKTKQKHRWQFEAIGTQWSIETVDDLGDEKAKILAFIKDYDKTFSRFRDDSLTMQLAQAPGLYEYPEYARPLVAFYKELYDATDGLVTPLVGGLLASAGYDKTYSLQQRELAAVPRWDAVMAWRSATVTTKAPVRLDFGAAGKGYLVDLIAGILEQYGHNAYVVDASGDMRIRGYKEKIGLENPYDHASVIGSVPMSDGSLCASATTRRAWGDGWHHVVNPQTSRPVGDIVATWVICPEAMIADGLATALFFVSPQALHGWQFEYVRLHANGSVERSPNFMGELYI